MEFNTRPISRAFGNIFLGLGILEKEKDLVVPFIVLKLIVMESSYILANCSRHYYIHVVIKY